MSHLKTQMDFLTKYLISGKVEKVKYVGWYIRGAEFDLEKEENYQTNQGDILASGQENQGKNY